MTFDEFWEARGYNYETTRQLARDAWEQGVKEVMSAIEGPPMPAETPRAVINAYRCSDWSTTSPCPSPCACNRGAHDDYQMIRRTLLAAMIDSSSTKATKAE